MRIWARGIGLFITLAGAGAAIAALCARTLGVGGGAITNREIGVTLGCILIMVATFAYLASD